MIWMLFGKNIFWWENGRGRHAGAERSCFSKPDQKIDLLGGTLAVSKKPDHSNVESNLDSRLESNLNSRLESTLESNLDSNVDLEFRMQSEFHNIKARVTAHN